MVKVLGRVHRGLAPDVGPDDLAKSRLLRRELPAPGDAGHEVNDDSHSPVAGVCVEGGTRDGAGESRAGFEW